MNNNHYKLDWYKDAFSEYIENVYYRDKLNSTIEDGYNVPDSDGSKSTLVRNKAKLNNTFNEDNLKDTLKEAFDNSSHKLIASNHDNTHFSQWHYTFNDMEYLSNTEYCQFTIPFSEFSSVTDPNSFIRGQYSNRWIKISEILNDYDTFKWNVLLFIDQKAYNEYELHIDSQVVTIKFKYQEYWQKQNHSISLYKFDTNYQSQIYISKVLCEDIWNWKIPIDYIKDQRITNNPRVIATINKISDNDLRQYSNGDGIEVLGDNMEFLTIKDGYIDLSNISSFNKNYIISETKEYLYMSLFVPKFLQEYPILLPVESTYRQANIGLKHLSVEHNGNVEPIYTQPTDDEYLTDQLHAVTNDDELTNIDKWNVMIRPIVLSDAYDNPLYEPALNYVNDLEYLRVATVYLADLIELFRLTLNSNSISSDDEFDKLLEDVHDQVLVVKELHDTFLTNMNWNTDSVYDILIEGSYNDALEDIRLNRENSVYLTTYTSNDNDYWTIISPLVWIPRDLSDKFNIVRVIDTMKNRFIWSDVSDYEDQVRFQRPVDVTDFWMFEYDSDNLVWRPCVVEMNHKFPDIYLLQDDDLSPGRLFKALFFYSDTINVVNVSSDIERPSPMWDTDMEKYHVNNRSKLQNINLEKIYWMAINTVYGGKVESRTKWELIEYIINNDTYKRFDQLFMSISDPYFTHNVLSYFNSANYNFLLDYYLEKMKEAIHTKFIGYEKLHIYEMYLEKNSKKQYFDYIEMIEDDWDPYDRLVIRPSSSFDIDKFLKIILGIQLDLYEESADILKSIEYILFELGLDKYAVDSIYTELLKSDVLVVIKTISNIIESIDNFDMEIYDINDLNSISELLGKHLENIVNIESEMSDIFEDTITNDNIEFKYDILSQVRSNTDGIWALIEDLLQVMASISVGDFINGINDLSTYFVYDKDNPDDESFLYEVNQFNDPWSVKVKDSRDVLFVSSSNLIALFEDKLYSDENIKDIYDAMNSVKDDISSLVENIIEFWDNNDIDHREELVELMDRSYGLMTDYTEMINDYYNKRSILLDAVDNIRELLDEMTSEIIGYNETMYKENILSNLQNIMDILSNINTGEVLIDDIESEYTSVYTYLDFWVSFVDNELLIYNELYNISEQPVPFYVAISNTKGIIEVLITYIEDANNSYIPDTYLPTYLHIYDIESISISTAGLLYQKDDMIYIPNVGVYTVDGIYDDSKTITTLTKCDFRSITYRDPMSQVRSYQTSTDGSGIGLSIDAISSIKYYIKYDKLLENDVELLYDMIEILINSLSNFNSAQNDNLTYYISKTSDTIDNINLICTNQSANLTDEVLLKSIEFCEELSLILTTVNTFMNTRNNINMSEFISLIVTAVSDINNYDSKYTTLNSYNETLSSCNTVMRKMFIVSSTSFNYDIYPNVSEIISILNTIYTYLRSNGITIATSITDAITFGNNIVSNMNILNAVSDSTTNELSHLLESIIDYSSYDEWYCISNTNVTNGGTGFRVGDIIQIVNSLPMNEFGEEITDNKDIILNDTILYQVTSAVDGIVSSVVPFMNYALEYKLYGVHETTVLSGDGDGLVINITSSLIEYDETKLKVFPDPFDSTDLLMFKFNNIYDLDIDYEVFFGGIQELEYIKRHLDEDNIYSPNKVDVIYLNANDVMNLRNSMIYIAPDNYFIYTVDSVTIDNPGAGYAVGQMVYMSAGINLFKFKVESLDGTPYKGIGSLTLEGIDNYYERENPSATGMAIITDSLNNIDDEFNVGYYDKIGSGGVVKSYAHSIDDKYIFKRFDGEDGDDRNAVFMYPDVSINLSTISMLKKTDMSMTPLPGRLPYTGGRSDVKVVIKADMNDYLGDPDYKWLLGNRIDNSQHPMVDKRIWNGIENVIPPTVPFYPDYLRTPPGIPIKSDFQQFNRSKFINVNVEYEVTEVEVHNEEDMNYSVIKIINNPEIDVITADLYISRYQDLPKNVNDWADGSIGKSVIVLYDEENEMHRTLYTIKSFTYKGDFVYFPAVIVDTKYNTISIDWMNSDYHPDRPTITQRYYTAPWLDGTSFHDVEYECLKGKYPEYNAPEYVNNTSFIHNFTMDDISVFNYTLQQWEDLDDINRWKLHIHHDNNNKYWGFDLTLISDEQYQYDLALFLNKSADSQMRNATLKENADGISISSKVVKEIIVDETITSVNTGRNLIIRKLFPYKYTKSYTIGAELGQYIDFELPEYMHYNNDIHLNDIHLYNKTLGRYEDVFDSSLVTVHYEDEKCIDCGIENHMYVNNYFVSNPGRSFISGEVWGYNSTYDVHIFGDIVVDHTNLTGEIEKFTLTNCVNMPDMNVTIQFTLYQTDSQVLSDSATVIVEFVNKDIEVNNDGYIHNVVRGMSIVPKRIRLEIMYNLEFTCDYEVRINKSQDIFAFSNDSWDNYPVFSVPDKRITQNNMYIKTAEGRLPLINPSSGTRTFITKLTDSGTEVTFTNVYKPNEVIYIITTPYYMRSVYTLASIPSHGYINLYGKLNKPLNKRYYEFWVNGKLLTNEVSIISPTKLILHGLTSLKNFEIIEINRDSDEYFSDEFLYVKYDANGRPYKEWRFDTYLDDVLNGVGDDPFTLSEQSYLLYPVFEQVGIEDSDYKNFPPNCDNDEDVFTRIDAGDYPVGVDPDDITYNYYMPYLLEADNPYLPDEGGEVNFKVLFDGDLKDPEIVESDLIYEYMVTNKPTIEGVYVTGDLVFDKFGFIPIDDQTIIDILNEVWADEIENNPYLPPHIVVDDDMWYGTVAKLFTSEGSSTNSLNATAYNSHSDDIIEINKLYGTYNIIRNSPTYDLD